MADYGIEGAEGLALHHFYRAMAWLGEELGEKAQGALVARCVKDVIEEKLFARRQDLFTDLSLVFMDTTSLSFHGTGGETLGKRGHSKDFRPDLAQMILALVVDAEGRPICTEMVPGNTADVTVLLPVVDRLRTRFGVTRACVVADRGMISADTIAALEKLGMEYILGARERSSGVIHNVVLNDTAPMVPLVLERQRGETHLWVKEVRSVKTATSSAAMTPRPRRTRPTARRSSPASRHSSRRATRHWSATRPTGVTSRPAARTSRSMSASLPRKPATTVSPWCGPTRRCSPAVLLQ
ncbi:IS1634 family transposase [Mesorhizobium sp. M0496]|uniref:IS1634 family transposase n=1 Tax=Mesorhizobium sp. M0496 TaxID=2956952 RepID=UPI00333B0442